MGLLRAEVVLAEARRAAGFECGGLGVGVVADEERRRAGAVAGRERADEFDAVARAEAAVEGAIDQEERGVINRGLERRIAVHAVGLGARQRALDGAGERKAIGHAVADEQHLRRPLDLAGEHDLLLVAAGEFRRLQARVRRAHVIGGEGLPRSRRDRRRRGRR